jgi:predicted TPR repeat methyltransferase
VAADLSTGLPDSVGEGFDVVIAADIVEHLDDARGMLAELAGRARTGGSVIVSVPNFAHWYPRSRVVVGRFDYDQRGILDETHLRFFTRRSFLRTAREAGLEPVRHEHTGLPLDALGVPAAGAVDATIGRLDRALVAVWPTMFAYQFVYQLIPRAMPAAT